MRSLISLFTLVFVLSTSAQTAFSQGGQQNLLEESEFIVIDSTITGFATVVEFSVAENQTYNTDVVQVQNDLVFVGNSYGDLPVHGTLLQKNGAPVRLITSPSTNINSLRQEFSANDSQVLLSISFQNHGDSLYVMNASDLNDILAPQSIQDQTKIMGASSTGWYETYNGVTRLRDLNGEDLWVNYEFGDITIIQEISPTEVLAVDNSLPGISRWYIINVDGSSQEFSYDRVFENPTLHVNGDVWTFMDADEWSVFDYDGENLVQRPAIPGQGTIRLGDFDKRVISNDSFTYVSQTDQSLEIFSNGRSVLRKVFEPEDGFGKMLSVSDDNQLRVAGSYHNIFTQGETTQTGLTFLETDDNIYYGYEATFNINIAQSPEIFGLVSLNGIEAEYSESEPWLGTLSIPSDDFDFLYENIENDQEVAFYDDVFDLVHAPVGGMTRTKVFSIEIVDDNTIHLVFASRNNSVAIGASTFVTVRHITITRDIVDSVDELELLDVAIYPNPVANGQTLNLDLPESLSSNATVEIFDLMGQIVVRSQASSQLILDDLKPGQYYLLLQDEKMTVHRPLVVR